MHVTPYILLRVRYLNQKLFQFQNVFEHCIAG